MQVDANTLLSFGGPKHVPQHLYPSATSFAEACCFTYIRLFNLLHTSYPVYTPDDLKPESEKFEVSKFGD